MKDISKEDFILTRSNYKGLQMDQLNGYRSLQRIAKVYDLEVTSDIVDKISNKIVNTQYNPSGLKPNIILEQDHNQLRIIELKELILKTGNLSNFLDEEKNKLWLEEFVYEYADQEEIASLMIKVRKMASSLKGIGINPNDISRLLFDEFGYSLDTDEFDLHSLRLSLNK